MSLLAFAGWGMGLRQLTEPADVVRLSGVAALAAVLVPSLAGLAEAQFGTPPEFTPSGASTMLAAAAGIIIAGSLPLTFQPPPSWRPDSPHAGTRRTRGDHCDAVVGDHRQRRAEASSAAHRCSCWCSRWDGPPRASGRSSPRRCSTASPCGWPSSPCAGRVVRRGGGDPVHALIVAQTYLLVTGLGVLMLAVYAQRVRVQDIEAGQSAEILYSALDGAGAQLFLKRYDADTDRFVYVDANDTLADKLGLAALGLHRQVRRGPLRTGPGARRFREQDEHVLTTRRATAVRQHADRRRPRDLAHDHAVPAARRTRRGRRGGRSQHGPYRRDPSRTTAAVWCSATPRCRPRDCAGPARTTAGSSR